MEALIPVKRLACLLVLIRKSRPIGQPYQLSGLRPEGLGKAL